MRISINNDGTLTYTPQENFDGKDSFYYVITDGKDFTNAKVSLSDIAINSINDVEVAEKDENTDIQFTISLNKAAQETITVEYSTSDDTATAGEDYIQSSGTITFEPGETQQTISITVLGDDEIEENERFFVNLDNPNAAAIADNQGIATITNDDIAPPQNTIELFRFRNTTFETGTYIFVGEAERDFILSNRDLSNNFALDGKQEDGTINAAFTASTVKGEDLLYPFIV